MNKIIERVARALWALETETDCHDWDQLGARRKAETYIKAKAAIAAMREPERLYDVIEDKSSPHNGQADGHSIVNYPTNVR